MVIFFNNLNTLFQLKRKQFLNVTAFAITINKSQGQTFNHVGVDLQTEVFSHGQLYVAVSRCTSEIDCSFFSKKRTNFKRS